MELEILYQITHFLHKEAKLLDHRKYKEWLELLTDDIVYRMPMRLTMERRSGSDIIHEMTYFEETKESLASRVKRLYAKSAWVEDPPPRQRHFISNIMIEPSTNTDEYHVSSYFDFKRSIGSNQDVENIFGEREDIIRQVDGEWKIASRVIYPDEAILNVRNLSMFL